MSKPTERDFEEAKQYIDTHPERAKELSIDRIAGKIARKRDEMTKKEFLRRVSTEHPEVLERLKLKAESARPRHSDTFTSDLAAQLLMGAGKPDLITYAVREYDYHPKTASALIELAWPTIIDKARELEVGY